MSDDGTGVVDDWLRFEGYSNLFCCDVSVFPTVPAANPSLTLVALALNTSLTMSCDTDRGGGPTSWCSAYSVARTARDDDTPPRGGEVSLPSAYAVPYCAPRWPVGVPKLVHRLVCDMGAYGRQELGR